jgi:NAD(P)-dependent dehydrogenase (short-subunit alcohol dehydrogenase family)
MRIADCVAIVTGGASGLGAATAGMLVAHGAEVVILDIDEAAGRKTADRIGAKFVNADIAVDEDVTAAFEAVQSSVGTARILVGCAGVAPAIPTLGYHGPHPMDAFRRTLEVNLIGTYAVVAAFAAGLSALEPIGEERGVVILTASIAAFDGQARLSAYSASKAGLTGMILPIALDLADYKIRVMGIAPGLFQTRMLEDIPGAGGTTLFSQVPHPSRAGTAQEFAHLVQAIVDNPMLNGDVIRLDGGLRLAPS